MTEERIDARAWAGRLLRRAPGGPSADGVVAHVEPEGNGWDLLTFTAWRLEPGQSIEQPADDQERLVLVLEGTASGSAGDLELQAIGSRETVFDGPPPPVLLVAPGDALRLEALSHVLIAIGAAPAGTVRTTRYTPPGDVPVEERGSGNTQRRVHHLLPPSAEAGRLIAFEVFTPAGNWSSYPPHKHDTEDPPTEARLEELYFYRFERPRGFGFQRVYTPDRALDESMAVGDGDLVLVPVGYHPFAAAAGYEAYYLNVMAGPNRAWHFTIDPDHAWLMNWAPPPGRDGE
jgi:5-deoxy-glucuronate isomerase